MRSSARSRNSAMTQPMTKPSMPENSHAVIINAKLVLKRIPITYKTG